MGKESKKELYLEAQEDIADILFPDEEEEGEPPAKKGKKKDKKGKKGKKKDKGDDDAPSLNAVRKAMKAYSKEYGKDEAKELLEPYDVSSLSALDEEDYQSLLDDINEASD